MSKRLYKDKRKHFFFAKMKQKTPAHWRSLRCRRQAPANRSFFASFLQKKKFFLPAATTATAVTLRYKKRCKAVINCVTNKGEEKQNAVNFSP